MLSRTHTPLTTRSAVPRQQKSGMWIDAILFGWKEKFVRVITHSGVLPVFILVVFFSYLPFLAGTPFRSVTFKLCLGKQYGEFLAPPWLVSLSSPSSRALNSADKCP